MLNSDNINVTAESFDYGPWRWTPYWDGHFTAAYFDHAGLYSFGRQPEAIHWDLVQLALALREVAPAEALTRVLETFPDRFQRALRDALFERLGIVPGDFEQDMKLVIAIEEELTKRPVQIERFFFDWRGGALRRPSSLYDGEGFSEVRSLVAGYAAAPGALDHGYWSDEGPCTMHIGEVEALWSAIAAADDWSPLHAKVAAVRRMGAAKVQTAARSGLQNPSPGS